jgi:hypothetical protein
MDRLKLNITTKYKKTDFETERKIQNDLFKTFYLGNFSNKKDTFKEKSILEALSIENLISKPVKIINKRTLNIGGGKQKTSINTHIKKPEIIPMKNMMLIPLRLTYNKDMSTETPKNKLRQVISCLETVKKEDKSKIKRELIFSSYKLSRNYRIINKIFSNKIPKLDLSHFHEISMSKNLTKSESSKREFMNSSEEHPVRRSENLSNKTLKHHFISGVKKDMLIRENWELNCK